MKSRGDAVAPARSRSSLSGQLIAVAPDVTDAEEHRRRKELVRQRLLGDGTPGARIGRFTLLGQVGAGAMSVVYAAHDHELDRRVAVKLLRAPLAESDLRLQREAQAMARLAHPNVVAVYEIGHWEGRLFIAMELVLGQTLEEWMGAGRRAWPEIVDVFLQAGRGLAAAHELGLVHRDFKPANVMVGEDGRARVLDFGLVRRTEQPGAAGAWRGDEDAAASGEPTGSGSLTATGACLGTPAYMAPDQRAGMAADALSDQFSFCVALHEAIFGARPGEARAARERPRRERPPPARLARAIERGLAADRRARWPSMGHLLGELERMRSSARRWRTRAAMAVLAALAVGVALVGRHLLQEQAARQQALAHDARLVVAAQRLIERDPTAAAAALREVRFPDRASGWRSTATAVLLEPLSSAVIRGSDRSAGTLMFDGDGSHVLRVLLGVDVMIWPISGAGAPRRISNEPGSGAIVSPDRRWVLAWKPTGGKAVLSRIDGGERRTLGELDERMASVAFTGDGTDAITVSTEGVARLWRAGGSELLGPPPRELHIEDASRWTFSLPHAGAKVIGIAPSGEHWLWHAGGTGPAVRLWTRPQAAPGLQLPCSLNGRWLGVDVEEHDLQLWNLEAGGRSRIFHGHEQKVAAFDVSPDGRLLATASHDGTARIWPMDGAGEVVVLRGHTEPLTGVCFDPAGRRVVTTARDRTARVWSLDGSGDVMVLRGHAHHVAMAAFSPDGGRVATYGLEPTLRIWDVSRRPVRILGEHAAGIWSAALDPAGRRLITAALDGTAKIFHLDGARPTLELHGHEGSELYAALFSPDGRRVATGGADGTARIWSADGTGEPLVLGGHIGWVYGMAFSPDGRWLATGGKDGEIRISPADGPGPARVLERGSGRPAVSRVHSLSFSPGGDRLAVDTLGSEGTAALLWPGGAPRRTLGSSSDGPLAGRTQLATSRDGRIATGNYDGTLRVWSADGEGPLAVLRGHAAEIHDLAFSRDGRRLLSASFDDSARIWDLERGGEPIVLRGHEDWVNKAGFDAGERRVVTASADRTARVWRLDDPDQPIVLRGHMGEVRFAGFTPEGRVVTASLDGTVRLWSLDAVAADVPSLMEQLRRATTACLPADRRMQYLLETASLAAERFAACERAAGRDP